MGQRLKQGGADGNLSLHLRTQGYFSQKAMCELPPQHRGSKSAEEEKERIYKNIGIFFCASKELGPLVFEVN